MTLTGDRELMVEYVKANLKLLSLKTRAIVNKKLCSKKKMNRVP
jgi:hypothetical protein